MDYPLNYFLTLFLYILFIVLASLCVGIAGQARTMFNKFMAFAFSVSTFATMVAIAWMLT